MNNELFTKTTDPSLGQETRIPAQAMKLRKLTELPLRPAALLSHYPFGVGYSVM